MGSAPAERAGTGRCARGPACSRRRCELSATLRRSAARQRRNGKRGTQQQQRQTAQGVSTPGSARQAASQAASQAARQAVCRAAARAAGRQRSGQHRRRPVPRGCAAAQASATTAQVTGRRRSDRRRCKRRNAALRRPDSPGRAARCPERTATCTCRKMLRGRRSTGVGSACSRARCPACRTHRSGSARSSRGQLRSAWCDA